MAMSNADALFTCYTCGVGFTEPQLQRDHYKTDWHRYNLKRKVAALPPVTADDFHERARVQRQQAEKDQETVILKCLACQKSFSSRNTYDNHLQSRRHKQNEEQRPQDPTSPNVIVINGTKKNGNSPPGSEKGGTDAKMSEKKPMVSGSTLDTEPMDEDDDYDSDGSWASYNGEGLSVEECLFCSVTSDDLETNLQHMTMAHSFFIPDAEYLVDVEGLLSYLGCKVGEGNLCLWCSGKGRRFHSTSAVQQHMIEKGHTKMLHEGATLAEYADFYDYRSSYPNYVPGQKHDNDDDDDDESMDTDTSSMDRFCDNGYELVLPSGATIGHRILMKYYRQKFPAERRDYRKILPKLLSEYRALGWTGTSGAMAHKKAADIKFMERARRKYDLRVQRNANSQKYFKDPNGLIR